MNAIGSRLYDLRTALGMTLEEVGSQVGVSKSTVRKWETGQIANMKGDKIAALAKALRTTPGYIMGWTTDPNIETAPQENKRPAVQENNGPSATGYELLNKKNRKIVDSIIDALVKVQDIS